MAGSGEEAMAVANGLIEAAEATGKPVRALVRALRLRLSPSATPIPPARLMPCAGVWRSLKTAATATTKPNLANILGRLEAEHGDPLAALDHLSLAIRNFHDSGNTTVMHVPLAALAALFDRLGRYEPAATIAGFAFSPLTERAIPEINTAITHLRDVLGDADLRIARPQGRDDDHRRHGDLRIRPNRPGPNRTERGLEIDSQ